VQRARQLVVNRFRDGMPVVGRMVDDWGFRRVLVVGLVMTLAVSGCARHDPGNPFIGPEGSGTQAPIGKQMAAPAPVIAAKSSSDLRALP